MLRLLCVLGAPAAALLLGAGCASLPPDDVAADALVSDDLVTVEVRDDLTGFLPVTPATDAALAFYPGGLVQEDAYAPLLHALAARGVPAVLVPMPSDLAVFAPKKGRRAIEAFPELGPWVAGGHSLGGAMAATWADIDRDELAGLVLLAAYPAGGRDLSDVSFPVLSVRASEDGVLDLDTWEERRALLPDDTAFVVIDGGNHAGFGAYGPQDGDGEATIPPEQQWAATLDAVVPLMVDGALPAAE